MGQDLTWKLPDYDQGSYDIKQVSIELEDPLNLYITFDEQLEEFQYSDAESSS